jgi:hypothetical protein
MSVWVDLLQVPPTDNWDSCSLFTATPLVLKRMADEYGLVLFVTADLGSYVLSGPAV